VVHILLWGFSAGGKYTAIIYAEEGSPSILIYETESFYHLNRL
jgi:hypothetical protein